VELQIQAPSPNSEKDSMIMPCAIKSSFDKTGFHALSRRLFLFEFELSISLLDGDPSLYSMYSVQCKHRGTVFPSDPLAIMNADIESRSVGCFCLVQYRAVKK
jgi:hypothetical protein